MNFASHNTILNQRNLMQNIYLFIYFFRAGGFFFFRGFRKRNLETHFSGSGYFDPLEKQ